MKAPIRGGNRHQSCHKVVHSYNDILGYKAIQILKFLEAKQDLLLPEAKQVLLMLEAQVQIVSRIVKPCINQGLEKFTNLVTTYEK
jgi:hypothetical protein